MKPSKLFPLVITDKLPQVRAYYTEVVEAEISIETETYLQIRFGAEAGAPELAFMTPPEANSPMGRHEPFGGQGLIVSIPRHNADEACSQMRQRGANIVFGLSDKPWGWRSFATRDPAGVLLDFFHELEDSSAVDATG